MAIGGVQIASINPAQRIIGIICSRLPSNGSLSLAQQKDRRIVH
jgi:hypothetical protein